MVNMRTIYIKIIMCINISLWIICFAILSLVDRARPPFESFLNRIKHLPVRKTWNLDLMGYVYYLLILGLIISICSIILNIIAHKKEKISFRFTPFFLGPCLLYALVEYLVHF